MAVFKSVLTFVKQRRDVFTFLLWLGIYFVVATLLGIPCPIRFVTGASCPGCGMSRALIALFTGRFALAWYYHPLVYLLLPFAALMVVCSVRQMHKTRKAVLLISALLLLAVYLYRVLVLHSDVVTVDFEKGVFVRLFRQLGL